MQPITPAALAQAIAGHRKTGRILLVGITGSVAVGKTTLAAQMAAALPGTVELVGTDGFLRRNADLDAAGLAMRKGFPETYDREALAATLAALRQGPAMVPGYSHALYDVDPALTRSVAGDVVIVEGLGLAPTDAPPHVHEGLDLLLYIDAEPADIEAWYVARFMGLWAAAADDPASFYRRFRDLDEAGASDFARHIWATINRPNLEHHIIRARDVADIVVKKAPDHSLHLVTSRK